MEAMKLVILFCLAVMAEMARAHIAEYDEVWLKRAADSRRRALQAYHPNPEEVNEHLNYHVRIAMEGTNSTRRSLRKNKGPCRAMNPIDRCWRCRQDWSTDRKRLATCVLGFGRKTTGGMDGEIYVVTDASDNDLVNPKPGTLRHAVIQERPLWIIFGRSMIIRLNEELIVTSNKTIDGRGANVHIANGAGITVQFVHNVIIHGIHIHDIHAGGGGIIRDSTSHMGLRTASDGDGISVFGSTNVWIDHISMSNCKDGLIDVIEGSTAITISNCHMTHHNDVMLFGARQTSTMDTVMQITLAFNHFGKGLVQRMPRCRYGFVHVVNNDYTHWLMYAIGGSENPTIISQGNRYIAPVDPNAKEVTKRPGTKPEQWKDWIFRSEGDWMMNGAFFVPSGNQNTAHPYSKQDMISFKSATFVTRLTRFSGALDCFDNKPC